MSITNTEQFKLANKLLRIFEAYDLCHAEARGRLVRE